MFITFNIILILLVALIAYWWANQGLFSAILHLVCVILAGAIAFAFWEPLTTGVLLWGSGFDDYAWGVAFIMLFAVSLFILRIAADKIAPANVQLPNWANLAFGGVVGAAAGVITMGVVIIGTGFIQSSKSVMGFDGWQRGNGGRITEQNSLWVPFHKITIEFYSLLSRTSLSPPSGSSLDRYYPHLDQNITLVRDSAEQGKAKLSLKPDSSAVQALYQCSQRNRFAVTVDFKEAARDFGERLTLTSAQVQLITWPQNNPGGSAVAVFPDRWEQTSGRYEFDDIVHIASSAAADPTSVLTFEFPVQPGYTPQFIMIRGTRFRLPNAIANYDCDSGFGSGASSRYDLPRLATARDITNEIEVDNRIPFPTSMNQKPGTISVVEVDDKKYLDQGKALFPSGGSRPTAQLRIDRVFEPDGTKCVKVDISRESVADIYSVDADAYARLALIDSEGNYYYPIGYIHKRPAGDFEIDLRPQKYLRTIDQLPQLPSAGGQPLDLLVYVRKGVTIVGFVLDDTPIGQCNVPVPEV